MFLISTIFIIPILMIQVPLVYAVVQYETNEISVVPITWLIDTDSDELYSYWPKSNKSQRTLIIKMAPIEENWPIFKVSKIIGKYSSYEQAIAAERIAVESSESEDALKRDPGKRKIKMKSVHSPPPTGELIFSRMFEERTNYRSRISPDPSGGGGSSTSSVTISDAITSDADEDFSKMVTINMVDSVTNSDIMTKLVELQATLSMISLRLNTLESGERHMNDTLVGDNLIKEYLPLKDLSQLIVFDDMIKSNEESFKQLVQKYIQLGGKSENDFLRRILSITFSNSLATLCSWTGQKNNFKIRDLNIIKLMRGAVRKVFPTFSDCLFDKIAMEWLRHAKQRLLRETNN